MEEFGTTGAPPEKKPFKLGDEQYTAFKPKTAMLLEIAYITELEEDELGIAEFQAIMEFIRSCLLPEDADRIRERTLDPTDALDILDVVPLIRWLTEWAGKGPGTSPPASSTSRKSAGRTSTASSRRKPARTSGPSKRIGSATRSSS